MKKSRSFADLTLGPSQRTQLNDETPGPDNNKIGAKTTSSSSSDKVKHIETGKRKKVAGASFWWVYAFTLTGLVVAVLFALDRPHFNTLVELFVDCVCFRRLPATAQVSYDGLESRERIHSQSMYCV